MRIAIIGGGLAGCALAYILRSAGQDPIIYEAGIELAGGASGNESGLYSPRFSALRSPESDFYTAAFVQALQQFRKLEDIDWNPCGALHLITTDKKKRQLHRTAANWGWDAGQMRLLDKDEASGVANIDLDFEALHLPRSGWVSPRKLCAAYARDVDCRLNQQIDNLADVEAEIVILACGPAVLNFAPDLPITPVRGQTTRIRATERSARVKCCLSYDGYFMPETNGFHMVGATFQPEVDHTDHAPEDNDENIQHLIEAIPAIGSGFEVIGQRASVRASSRDRFPIVGRLTETGNLYVSTGHGSYGILSSLMGAQVLADMILGRPLCLPQPVLRILSPERFRSRQA